MFQHNPNITSSVDKTKQEEQKDYTPPKQSQFILVADKSFFENHPEFKFEAAGITTVSAHDFYGQILGATAVRRRYELDKATNQLPYRQFLPYDIMTKIGRDFKRRYFAYMRENTSGEAQLHNRVSIGGGGHIDASSIYWDNDVIDLAVTVHTSAQRERCEEFKLIHNGIVIPDIHKPDYFNKIFSTNTPTLNIMVVNSEDVDRRHFAIVNVGRVPEDIEVECAEAELKTLGFLTYEELTAVVDGKPKYNLESWTKVCLAFLEGKSATKVRPIGLAGEGLRPEEQKPQM